MAVENGFRLGEEKTKKFEKWLKEHKKKCKFKRQLALSLTPTSSGRIVKVACACGEEIDLTDYKNRGELIKKEMSVCCGVEVKTDGIPDFIGGDEIVTVNCMCPKCNKPCDIKKK